MLNRRFDRFRIGFRGNRNYTFTLSWEEELEQETLELPESREEKGILNAAYLANEARFINSTKDESQRDNCVVQGEHVSQSSLSLRDTVYSSHSQRSQTFGHLRKRYAITIYTRKNDIDSFQENFQSHSGKELLYYYGKKFFKMDPSIVQQELERQLRGGAEEGMSLEAAIFVK